MRKMYPDEENPPPSQSSSSRPTLQLPEFGCHLSPPLSSNSNLQTPSPPFPDLQCLPLPPLADLSCPPFLKTAIVKENLKRSIAEQNEIAPMLFWLLNISSIEKEARNSCYCCLLFTEPRNKKKDSLVERLHPQRHTLDLCFRFTGKVFCLRP